MVSILQNIPGVVTYIDGVLITGPDEGSYPAAPEEVLKHMKEGGLCLYVNKCHFMASEVAFLRYRINAKGLHPLPDKVCAVENAPSPKDVTNSKAYLGLLMYYVRFFPNPFLFFLLCCTACPRRMSVGNGQTKRNQCLKHPSNYSPQQKS